LASPDPFVFVGSQQNALLKLVVSNRDLLKVRLH